MPQFFSRTDPATQIFHACITLSHVNYSRDRLSAIARKHAEMVTSITQIVNIPRRHTSLANYRGRLCIYAQAPSYAVVMASQGRVSCMFPPSRFASSIKQPAVPEQRKTSKARKQNKIAK